MKSKLDLARREMRGAVINLDVPDDKLLELRADTRRLFEEVKGNRSHPLPLILSVAAGLAFV